MRRCFRFVLLGLLLFIAITPTLADALPYNAVVYGPLTSTKDGVQTIEVGVVAFGKYDAAMVALGYDGDYINGLSSDDRAKLSNQETGGDFWFFAQKFTLAPNDDVMSLNGITWKSLNALYGYGNVRRGVYTQGEAANAKRDLQTILDGGSLGGGGGSGDSDYLTFYGYPKYVDSSTTSYIKDVSGNGYTLNVRKNYTLMPSPVTIKIKPSGNFETFLETHKVTEYKYYCLLQMNRITDNLNTVQIFAFKSADNQILQNTYGNVGTDYINRVVNIASPSYSYIAGPVSYVYENDTVTIDNLPNANPSTYSGGSFTPDTGSVFLERGNGQAGPVIPPSNWPSAPEVPAPTAPEVPEPSEPERPSQPSQPTAPTLPDFPSNVIAPGTTYDTFDIQAILDAMDEHCQHIQSAIYQGFSDYFDTFTPWLRDEFSTLRTFLREEDDWIVESISDEFMELRSYLKELTEWLADQMDFTISGGDYDDSTVVSWLKKIYYKLGGASVNTKPVDPVGDPDGSWDWLNQLIEGILSALAGGAAALTGTLGELFQGIKDKFPFSIPWDIVAIVALLDAPPVTPAAVIEYDVFGAHVRYDIDLHFFDEQASVIRAMEDVLFCAFLLFKTDWLTGIFDGIGGFLGGKLKSAAKG